MQTPIWLGPNVAWPWQQGLTSLSLPSDQLLLLSQVSTWQVHAETKATLYPAVPYDGFVTS
jgi:hypothetical protein